MKKMKLNVLKYLKFERDERILELIKEYDGDVEYVINEVWGPLETILDEKTDQILLYTHLLFEKGHANAASIISQEAKEAQIRAWFLDPSSHIEYVPEKFAQKIIEYATLKNKLIGASNQKKRHKFLNSIKSISIILSLKKEITSKYWGLDVAIMNNIRIDKSNTQDTEKLHSLAQNAIRTGFHWTAYRLAHKSRTDISTIIQEVREIENTLKPAADSKQAQQTVSAAENLQTYPKHAPKQKEYEFEEAYPEQGIAINYILEFLHNFQHNT